MTTPSQGRRRHNPLCQQDSTSPSKWLPEASRTPDFLKSRRRSFITSPILAPLMNLLGIIRTQHGFNSGRRRRQHSRKRRRARLRTTAEWSNLREIKNAVRQPCSDDVLKTTITQRRPAKLTPPPRTRSKCALQRSRASPPKAFLHRSSWDSDIARDNSTDSRHRESQRSAE